VVMVYIGHRGATPFTQLVMLLACTFLEEEDLRGMLAAVRQRWMVLAGLLVAASVAAALVFDPVQWARYYLWGLATLSLGFAAACLVLPRFAAWLGALRAGRLASEVAGDFRRARLLPAERGARAALVVFLIACLWAGAGPYLGAKFRLSFAMFSNLRVDDARWNSLLVPRSVRLAAHDAYLHVETLQAPAGASLAGLYSRPMLELALRERRRANVRLELRVRYRGDERRFQDGARSPELLQWLAGLPDDRLFHDYLPATGPQPCIH
jgi:hypothetical protein